MTLYHARQLKTSKGKSNAGDRGWGGFEVQEKNCFL